MGYDSLYLYENDTGPDEANHAQYGFFHWSALGNSVTRSIDFDILDVAPTVLRQWISPCDSDAWKTILTLPPRNHPGSHSGGGS